MKKKGNRKINLNRETLRSLDAATLADIGGGATNGPGPRCNSGTCADTWSQCYISACSDCTFTCPV